MADLAKFYRSPTDARLVEAALYYDCPNPSDSVDIEFIRNGSVIATVTAPANDWATAQLSGSMLADVDVLEVRHVPFSNNAQGEVHVSVRFEPL